MPPSILLVPTAVPTGYGGEAHVPVLPPAYFQSKAVYGPPSIMLAAAVESPGHTAGYWPRVDAPRDNQYLRTVVSAYAPPVTMRGANRVKPGSRVAFRGLQFYNNVKAPSIDEVQRFMAGRGPTPGQG